jgi:beta-phosphoglucomutase
MKLIIFDFDGTLFNTKDANYYSYKEALSNFNFHLDYDYFCKECNGKNYLSFLPQISSKDINILDQIHKLKTKLYKKYIDYIIPNKNLIFLINNMKLNIKLALVTTASRENVSIVLEKFNLTEKFDLIICGEDVEKQKPNPEGFLRAINFFSVNPSETVIFEDSEVGIEAAELTFADVIIVKGYN